MWLAPAVECAADTNLGANVNWKEVVTAGGVITSLLFVGFEVRENTRAVRGATIQAIADQSFQYNTDLVQDENWMRLMAMVWEDTISVTSLGPEDRVRLSWGLVASTRIMENRYRQVQLGILGEEALGQLGGATNQNWYASRMFRDWWASSSPETRWSADFVAFMERDVIGVSGQ
ncbi:MAG: hypothetical protein RH859_11250 [Longimicrobiales bacterium]